MAKDTARQTNTSTPALYEALYVTQDAKVRATPGSDFYYRRYRPAMDVLHRAAVDMARNAADSDQQDDLDASIVEAVKRGLRTGYAIGELASREGVVAKLGEAWVDFSVTDQDIKAANELLVQEGAADHQRGELLRGVNAHGYDDARGVELVTDVVLNRELDELRAQAGDLAVGLAAGRLHQAFYEGVHNG